jgi:hypothetical protein
MPDTPERPDLRDELAKLAATQWTDYNAHDPGITILEQLDYALSDLAYRASFPVADLLAGHGADPNQDLPGPAEILSSKAVTDADVHALLADVTGVTGGWLVPRTTPELVFFHHADSRQLRFFDEAGTDPERVELDGVARVLVRKVESSETTAEGVVVSVGEELHAQRNACTDFEIGVYAPRPIWLHAELEIGPVDEPAALLANIFLAVEDRIAPTSQLASLAERQQAGARMDEIYEGPRLDHGFLARDQALPRPGNVRTSDIIRVLLDLPEVWAVRTLTLSLSETGTRQRWELSIPDGEAATVAHASPIRLLRAGLELVVDRAAVERHYLERRAAQAQRLQLAKVPERPRGRDRGVEHYRSVQDHFPRAYGIGRFGLLLDAPAIRRAHARQLEAYLLLCEQILANEFAQLAHVGQLFRWTGMLARSYVAGKVDGEGLRLDDLRLQTPKLDDDERREHGPLGSHDAWLDAQVGGDDSFERKNRFLNHLLARFSEQPVDHVLLQAQYRDDPEELIRDKQAFLKNYVEISSGRGAGHDVLAARSAAQLAERIRLRLGHELRPRFVMLEHLLLRPIAEDAHQRAAEGEEQVPLLDGVTERDPYSHQLSFVFFGRDPELHKLRSSETEYVRLVEQTLLEETPAHLTASILWLDSARWTTFLAAHADWRDKYAAYRQHKLHTGQIDAPPELHLPMRDARDRLIDMLGFGRSYPLRDLPVAGLLIVPPGDAAKIPVGFAQPGVSYRLHDARTGAPIADSTPVEGKATDDTWLLSPAIFEDVRYRIQATKVEEDPAAEPRSTWLHQLVIVEVGLDVTLTARIDAELLDPPQTGTAADSAPRIIFFGAQTPVVMPTTQEGVSYDLIRRLTPLPANASEQQRKQWREQLTLAPALSDTVIGTAGQIELLTRANQQALDEDIDLAIRAKKIVGSESEPELKIEQLNIILPLKVRAKRTRAKISAQLVPSAIVDYGGTATLRLSSSQSSASYGVHIRRTYDDAFVFERQKDGQDMLFRRLPGGAEDWLPAGPSNAILDVVVSGTHTVHVVRPPVSEAWVDEPRFQALAMVAGTGQPLELKIEQLHDDTTVLIEARKQHVNGPLDDPEALARPLIGSRVQLEQAVLVLVRPNPNTGLYLEAWYDGERVRFTANDGQPGVLYEFDGELDVAFADRAYFHKRDDYDKALNKGIGQLRVRGDEQDLADLSIARAQIDDSEGPATQAPSPPLLDTQTVLGLDVLGQLDGRTVGIVRAEKVLTRVTGSHVAVVVGVDRSDVGVDLLYGIGSVIAGRLADAGLATVGALANAELDGVVIDKITAAQLEHWQAAAKLLIEFSELGPWQAELLVNLEVASKQDAEIRLATPDGLTAEQIAALKILANS